jgi:uncharacterized membrane protein
MIDWATAIPAVSAAFLSSFVEIVEALTIVLAVATVSGWRPAVAGTITGLAILAVLVLLLGPLFDRIPLAVLQIGIGTLLLLFGMRWLRKAILRAAGIIPLHDEELAFAEETAHLREEIARQRSRRDFIAGATACKAVVLEGIEVVFIIIAVCAGRGLLIPASLGALAACLIVLLIGALVHRPLSRVPENTLKFGVGVMLSAFGVFWCGEGIGIAWPGHDWALPYLAAAFLAIALGAVWLARASVKQKSARAAT